MCVIQCFIEQRIGFYIGAAGEAHVVVSLLCTAPATPQLLKKSKEGRLVNQRYSLHQLDLITDVAERLRGMALED